MNKYISIMLHILISWPLASLAIDTNVNEVSNLFDQHIEDKPALLQNLKEQNHNAIAQIKFGIHHDSIEGIGAAQSKASELSTIKESGLDNAGRAQRASKEYQFYDENELEPDYTKPGNRLHKEDSEDIVSSTDQTMRKIGSNFMAKLNSEGFDCKTVKGAVQKEPTYYISINREQQKNTEYDQLFCEELRNTYNCNDKLSMNCTRQGIRWHKAEDRYLEASRDEINHFGFGDVFWSHKTGKKFFEIKLRGLVTSKRFFGGGGGVPTGMEARYKQFLATKHGVPTENILAVTNVGHSGGLYPSGRDKENNWRVYFFHYKYRESYKICEQWQETWDERCSLR